MASQDVGPHGSADMPAFSDALTALSHLVGRTVRVRVNAGTGTSATIHGLMRRVSFVECPITGLDDAVISVGDGDEVWLAEDAVVSSQWVGPPSFRLEVRTESALLVVSSDDVLASVSAYRRVLAGIAQLEPLARLSFLRALTEDIDLVIDRHPGRVALEEVRDEASTMRAHTRRGEFQPPSPPPDLDDPESFRW